MSIVHQKILAGAEILPSDITGINEVRLGHNSIVRRWSIDWSVEVGHRMEAVIIHRLKGLFAKYLPNASIYVDTVEAYRAEENEPTVCVAWANQWAEGTRVIIAPSGADPSKWGAYKVVDTYSAQEWGRDLDIDRDSIVPESWSIDNVLASLVGYIHGDFITADEAGFVHEMESEEEVKL